MKELSHNVQFELFTLALTLPVCSKTSLLLNFIRIFSKLSGLFKFITSGPTDTNVLPVDCHVMNSRRYRDVINWLGRI